MDIWWFYTPHFTLIPNHFLGVKPFYPPEPRSDSKLPTPQIRSKPGFALLASGLLNPAISRLRVRHLGAIDQPFYSLVEQCLMTNRSMWTGALVGHSANDLLVTFRRYICPSRSSYPDEVYF